MHDNWCGPLSEKVTLEHDETRRCGLSSNGSKQQPDPSLNLYTMLPRSQSYTFNRPNGG